MPAQVQVRPEEIKPLKAADPAELSKELGIVDPTTLTPMGVVEEADPELVKQAAEYADKLVSFSRGNIDAETSSKMAVEQMGRSLQNDAAKKSQMLLQPVKNLYSAGTEGSEVGKSLIQLRETVESLDPHKFDFEAGWGTRLVGLIPGVGTPIKRYFMRYESAETMIDSIVRSLDLGREQLYRDIVTLTGDQKDMRILTQKLEKTVKLGILIKRNLELKVAELSEGDERAAFIKDELLFPLSQRVQDLQQQLIVNQQGVLAMGIVIKNNIELIRGIYRAKDVTITALRVAVAVALALNNQRLQLQKIQALTQTTSNLIEHTSEQLHMQGAEINKMASSTMLDMESLKRSFTNIKATMDEISRFRQEALPIMAQHIDEMSKMSFEHEAEIAKMEKGDKLRPAIQIEVK